MRKLLILLIPLLLITACSTPPEPRPTATAPPQEPSSTSTPPLTNTPTDPPLPAREDVDVYNFLLLGGDYREHRQGTGYGDKTDVMLLVSIRMSDPVIFTVVQFPRNFYTKVEAMDDMWLFHVYGREGFTGLHYYFQQVFDVDLHGIAYINMDNFVTFVDGMGANTMLASGEDLLVYLRDNDNNWGCAGYDCGDRQFEVLKALAERAKRLFHEDPLTTAKYFWDNFGGLFEADLSEFEQIHWLIELGWRIATSEYEIGLAKLTDSVHFGYGDTPLEVRGWVIKKYGDAPLWMRGSLGGLLEDS